MTKSNRSVNYKLFGHLKYLVCEIFFFLVQLHFPNYMNLSRAREVLPFKVCVWGGGVYHLSDEKGYFW